MFPDSAPWAGAGPTTERIARAASQYLARPPGRKRSVEAVPAVMSVTFCELRRIQRPWDHFGHTVGDRRDIHHAM